jgi:hypothetical protein
MRLPPQTQADRRVLAQFSDSDILAVRDFVASINTAGETLEKGRVVRVAAETARQLFNAGAKDSLFRFDRATLKFVTARGVVADSVVKAAAESAVAAANFNIFDAAARLQSGKLDVASWFAEHNRAVKLLNGAESVLGRGGLGEAVRADWEAASTRVANQFGYSRAFAEDVASGLYGKPGEMSDAVLRRAGMYADAGRATYENTRVDNAKSRLGHNKARRILGDVDHCDGCVAAAEEGWVDIDDVLPIGDADCLSRCHCIIITGEEGNLAE